MVINRFVFAGWPWRQLLRGEKTISQPHYHPLKAMSSDRAAKALTTFRSLLDCHPLYATEDKSECEAAFKNSMFNLHGCDTEKITGLGDQSSSPPALDHFTAWGPTMGEVLYSIAVPDTLVPAECSEDVLNLTDIADTVGGAVYDMRQRAGMNIERAQSLKDTEWILHQLNHVHRGGAMNQVVIVFSLLLQRTLKQLRRLSDFTDNLMTFPGSSDYYEKKTHDLHAMQNWFGPPSWSITISLNASSNINLATWISHDAGTKDRPVQVWHRNSELELLTPLDGRQHPEETEENFFTHTRLNQLSSEATKDRVWSCPYHQCCSRGSIELYRTSYNAAGCTPNQLNTLSRTFQKNCQAITRNIIQKPSTGLATDFHTQVTQVPMDSIGFESPRSLSSSLLR
jgi:hypothetical protein